MVRPLRDRARAARAQVRALTALGSWISGSLLHCGGCALAPRSADGRVPADQPHPPLGERPPQRPDSGLARPEPRLCRPRAWTIHAD